MNPLTALFEAGKMAIERIWPDPIKRAEEVRKLEELHQAGDLARLDAQVKLLLGQIEINKIEAASSSLLVSGWRPFVGWIGGAAFAYSTILEPLMRFVATVFFEYKGTFPVINDNLTIQVLLGLLGLGMMRSYDKKNGTDTK